MAAIAVWMIVLVLFGHWVFDFLFQPHWMGMRKSKEWWVLIQHGLIITAGAFLVGWCITGLWEAIAFALVNGIAHVGIDAITSRITGKCYAKGEMHWFFTVIGFDQFLHMALAFITLSWIAL